MFTPMDYENRSIYDKLELIRLVGSMVKLGSASPFSMREYYNIEDWKKSPILFSKDKPFIKSFFFELINEVDLTWEQFRFLSSYIADKNGSIASDLLPLDPKGKKIGEVVTTKKLVLFLDGITDFLTEFFLSEFSSYEGKSNILIEANKKKENPTIGDIFYNLKYDGEDGK